MSTSIALAAFNTAVVITNAAHAAKRGAVKAAGQSKEAGLSFWAGMKYAHQQNKANAAAAERLTAEDIEAPQRKAAVVECPAPEIIEAPKPKAKAKATKAKAAARSAK